MEQNQEQKNKNILETELGKKVLLKVKNLLKRYNIHLDTEYYREAFAKDFLEKHESTSKDQIDEEIKKYLEKIKDLKNKFYNKYDLDKFVETFIGDQERVNYCIFRKTKNKGVIEDRRKNIATKNYIFSNENKKDNLNNLRFNFISAVILKNITDNYNGDEKKEEEIEKEIFEKYKNKVEKLRTKKENENDNRPNSAKITLQGIEKVKEEQLRSSSAVVKKNKKKKKVSFIDKDNKPLVETIEVESYKKYYKDKNFFTRDWNDRSTGEKVGFVLMNIGLGIISAGIFNAILFGIVRNNCACCSKEAINEIEEDKNNNIGK